MLVPRDIVEGDSEEACVAHGVLVRLLLGHHQPNHQHRRAGTSKPRQQTPTPEDLTTPMSAAGMRLLSQGAAAVWPAVKLAVWAFCQPDLLPVITRDP
ncbi:unnamed protein product [Boreogadus saida]